MFDYFLEEKKGKKSDPHLGFHLLFLAKSLSLRTRGARAAGFSNVWFGVERKGLIFSMLWIVKNRI